MFAPSSSGQTQIAYNTRSRARRRGKIAPLCARNPSPPGRGTARGRLITNLRNDRYGLYFPDTNTNAVMYTDATGAATVRIAMPANMQSSLIFHYNLKFYDSDGDNYDGVSLKRFVMQVSRFTGGTRAAVYYRNAL